MSFSLVDVFKHMQPFAMAIVAVLLNVFFNGVKGKRVAWVKEADSNLQDHKDNECFVEEISITPPKGFTEEAPAAD